MNEENTNNQIPDLSEAEMKMPENADFQKPTSEEDDSTALSAPVLAILAVVLIAILAGLYYWFTTMSNSSQNNQAPAVTPVERPAPVENNEPESTTAEAQTEALGITSTSDEISAIEADVESTDLDSLDAELNAIDAEINAALQQ